MAGRQDGTPIAEAARLLGLSQEAVRKRLQRATLAGYKRDDHWYVLLDGQDATAGQRQDSRPDGGRTVAGRQDTTPEEPPAAPEPIEAAYRVAGEAGAGVALVPLATMVEELRGLADQLADLARRNEGLALEVGQLREREAGQAARLAGKDQALAAQQETIAALRRRAEAAEAARLAAEEERAALRLRLVEVSVPPVVVVAAQEAPEGVPATDTTPAAQRPLQGLWQRLRRWLVGR